MPSPPVTTQDSIRVPFNCEKHIELRQKLNLTKAQLARKSGVTERTITRREKRLRDDEGRPLPNYAELPTVDRLAKALGCASEALREAPRSNHHHEPALPAARGDGLEASARRFSVLAKELNRILDSSNVLSTFIGSCWDQVNSGVVVNQSNERVEVSYYANDYYSLLRGLPDDARRGVRAFADLSDPTEKDLWSRHKECPELTWVHERVFFTDWVTVHDDQAMSKLVDLLVTQSKYRPGEHKVRLGIIDSPRPPMDHPLGQDGVGWHLLLHDDSFLIGGYKSEPSTDQIRTVLISDPGAYKKAKRFYDSLRRRTVQIFRTDDATAIHRRINKLCKLGTFKGAWASRRTQDRDEDYFSRYSRNIRRWEPFYDEMKLACALAIEHEVVRRFHTGRAPSLILEIGVGDGGLTQHVAPWCDAMNKEMEQVQFEKRYVEKYFGIDMASQMLERLPPELRRYHCVDIKKGCFPNEYKLVVNYRKVDILCGSLVLHDIIGVLEDGGTLQTVHAFLAAARECLADDGVAIFADSFTSSTPSLRDIQIAQWKDEMVARRGLTHRQADDFVARNPEMVRTLNDEHLKQLAGQYGFEYTFLPASIKPLLDVDEKRMNNRILLLRWR
jgi:SAM-dependent methyltransferase/transcriptional regulator with XRE-family HTH domain